MSSPDRDDSRLSYGEINRELDALTGHDPATSERQAELIDMLLSSDMGAGPARRAMCQRTPTDGPESTDGSKTDARDLSQIQQSQQRVF